MADIFKLFNNGFCITKNYSKSLQNASNSKWILLFYLFIHTSEDCLMQVGLINKAGKLFSILTAARNQILSVYITTHV